MAETIIHQSGCLWDRPNDKFSPLLVREISQRNTLLTRLSRVVIIFSMLR